MKKKKITQQDNTTAELEKLRAGWQRCQADFDNFRRRTESEKQQWQKQAQLDLMLELLPILDNFELALSHLSDEQKKDPTMQGIFHIQNQLISTMQNLGVEKIAAEAGQEFDPNFHEAVSSHEGKGGTKIHSVHSHGYKAGETVLRPAKVVVKQ